MNTKIQPLYNCVIVEPIELEFKTAGGIVIQEQGTRALNMQTGRVIAVGPGMITPEGGLVPLKVKVGDKVLFVRGSGVELRYSVNAPKHLMFKETDLFGILDDEQNESV
jgi:chaperonin GroES